MVHQRAVLGDNSEHVAGGNRARTQSAGVDTCISCHLEVEQFEMLPKANVLGGLGAESSAEK